MHNRAFVWLLGMHGLAMVVVFPLGPQQARLWNPGVPGVAAAVAAFPIAVVVGGLLARRASRLPVEPRTLSIIAFLATLPAALSVGYPSFFAARIIGGLAAGMSYVALHRLLSVESSSLVSRLAPRIVAFGLPVCLSAAAWFDWRATFVPILAGLAGIAFSTPRALKPQTPPARDSLTETVPVALFATGALAFVSGAYLTVLSGFLVYNTGHTELHILVVLMLGALLGLAVPPALARLSSGVAPAVVFTTVLFVSMLNLTSLLALQGPLPALFAVGLIGCFLAVNGARHFTLARLTMPLLRADQIPAHQTHTHLVHHLGSAFGALVAGCIIAVDSAGKFTGMPILLGYALAATALALAAGLVIAHPMASPAARAASANRRWRVAASLVRSVRTSIMRTPGSPT